MTQKLRKNVLATGVAAALALSGINMAWAGLKSEENVSVTVSGSSATAAGAVGTARASADTVQFIRCTVQGFATSNSIFCSARSAAGTNFSCTANGLTNPARAIAVAAMSEGSRLFIAANNGECTQIDVTNSSANKPKVP
jgi:hypothetical protein